MVEAWASQGRIERAGAIAIRSGRRREYTRSAAAHAARLVESTNARITSTDALRAKQIGHLDRIA
jgi:hypothetical protein